MEYQEPFWVQYAGDLFFLILFLVVWLFFKSGKEDNMEEITPETEQPNDLEKILQTDPSEDNEPETPPSSI